MIRRVLASRQRITAPMAPMRAGLSLVDTPTSAAPPPAPLVDRPGRPAPAPADPIPEPPFGASSWSTEAAYAWCERVVRSHNENFPVASRFVPPPVRRHVWALYAFARFADDFADEPRYAGRRGAALDHWEDQLERAFHGEAEHPIFVALRDTVDRRDIPISPLRDLLTSFRMDLTTSRYPTFEALLTYAQHSAVPVGQLLLYIFDYRDPALHRYADDIAIALELTHFLQDLPLDLVRDRIYVPAEDLCHFGVTEEELRAGRATAGFRDLMRFQVARARALFQRGRPLTDRVGRDLAFELTLIWQGGMTILDKIDALDGDVFSQRPRLGGGDKLKMALRSAARRWPLPARLADLAR